MEDDDRTTEEGTTEEVLESPPGSPEIDSTSQFDDTIPTEEEEDTQILEEIDLEELEKTQIADSDGENTDGTEVLSENEDDGVEKGTELVEDDEIGGEDERGLDEIEDLNEEHRGSGSVPRRSISVHEDNGESVARDPANTDMQGREVDSDQGAKKSNGIMELTRGDTNCRVDGPTARRLFTTDAPHNSLPEHVADDPTFAGLSYVDSQEPGEQSQAYAINVVDRLISVDEDELPQEMNWGSAVKRNSPPVSMTKGTHMLAQRAKPRSPVGNVEIFEWDDDHEDEGGGVFFSNRKEELLGSSCQQKKSARPKGKRDKGAVDKVGEKEEHSKLCQKTKKLSRSDSRLPVSNLKENVKARPSRSRTIKNLCDELDEQLTMDTSNEQLEDRGLGKDLSNACDVGIDTEMAAEALGDLVSDIPSNRGTSVSPEAPNNAEACTVEETNNKVQSKRASLRKRNDPGGTLRQSKRIKTLDTRVSIESPPENFTNQEKKKIVSCPETTGKGRKAKANAIKHLDRRTADNENKISSSRSSKSVKQPVGKGDDPHIKEADVIHISCGRLSVENGQLKDVNFVCTPVARRTRRSLVVNPLKSAEVSGDDIGNVTDGVQVFKKGTKRLSSGKSQKNSEAKKLKGFVFESATKCAEGKVQKHLDTQVAVDENRTSCRRSSKRINQVHPVGAMNKTNMQELHRSPLSNEVSPLDGELQEENRIGTPIARRTRKSLAVDPTKSSTVSCNDIGDGTGALEVKKGKKRQSRGTSAPKERTGDLVSELPGSASKASQSLNTSGGRKHFLYKSFSDRIKDINVGETVFPSLDPQKAEPSDDSSFFRDCLIEWRELNTSEDFISFYEEMMPLIQPLPQNTLEQKTIVKILLDRLRVTARLSLGPILSLIAALSKDLLKDFLPFLNEIAIALVKLLEDGAEREPEVVDQIFTSWSYIMMYLKKYLIVDIVELLKVTRILRYYPNDYVQEFMAESVSFLFLNLPYKHENQLPEALKGTAIILVIFEATIMGMTEGRGRRDLKTEKNIIEEARNVVEEVTNEFTPKDTENEEEEEDIGEIVAGHHQKIIVMGKILVALAGANESFDPVVKVLHAVSTQNENMSIETALKICTSSIQQILDEKDFNATISIAGIQENSKPVIYYFNDLKCGDNCIEKMQMENRQNVFLTLGSGAAYMRKKLSCLNFEDFKNDENSILKCLDLCIISSCLEDRDCGGYVTIAKAEVDEKPRVTPYLHYLYLLPQYYVDFKPKLELSVLYVIKGCRYSLEVEKNIENAFYAAILSHCRGIDEDCYTHVLGFKENVIVGILSFSQYESIKAVSQLVRSANWDDVLDLEMDELMFYNASEQKVREISEMFTGVSRDTF